MSNKKEVTSIVFSTEGKLRVGWTLDGTRWESVYTPSLDTSKFSPDALPFGIIVGILMDLQDKTPFYSNLKVEHKPVYNITANGDVTFKIPGGRA